MYAPLADYLRQQSGALHIMSFAEIERVVGKLLPPSSRKRRQWWGNDRYHSQSKDGWLTAGWQVDSVNLIRETVTFRR